MMDRARLLVTVILVALQTCVALDQYIDLKDPADISSTINSRLSPGKCYMKLGDGPLFGVRYFRRFVYPDQKYSCLNFHCTKLGEIKLMYWQSGCVFNNTCLKFGETVIDDQCRAWTCAIDYRLWVTKRIIHMGIFIDRMKTKCKLNGKCIKRGEFVYDKEDCVKKRCTVYGRPLGRWSLGHLQYWRPHVADCKVNGQCYKSKSLFEIGCVTYKCNNVISTTPKTYPDGTVIKSYNVTGGISFIERKCKKFNSNECIDHGSKTKFGTCIEYTCAENGTNLLTKEGCPNAVTKQCGDIGDVISPLACVKLECKKKNNRYSYETISEGCYNNESCIKVNEAGFDKSSKCLKVCKKIVVNGMISYKFAGACVDVQEEGVTLP